MTQRYRPIVAPMPLPGPGRSSAAAVASGVSTGKPTSVDVQDRSIHVIRLRRGEKQKPSGDLVRPGPVALRDAGTDCCVAHLVVAQRLGHLCCYIAGRDGVD